MREKNATPPNENNPLYHFSGISSQLFDSRMQGRLLHRQEKRGPGNFGPASSTANLKCARVSPHPVPAGTRSLTSDAQARAMLGTRRRSGPRAGQDRSTSSVRFTKTRPEPKFHRKAAAWGQALKNRKCRGALCSAAWGKGKEGKALGGETGQGASPALLLPW